MAPHARTTSRILGAEDASLPASSSAAAHQLVQARSRLADVARDLGMLLRDGRESRMARTAGELGAAVESMEKATDRIIRSAEMIDDCAKALAAARISTYEQGIGSVKSSICSPWSNGSSNASLPVATLKSRPWTSIDAPRRSISSTGLVSTARAAMPRNTRSTRYLTSRPLNQVFEGSE